jgi:hypothetical protein
MEGKQEGINSQAKTYRTQGDEIKKKEAIKERRISMEFCRTVMT